MWTQEQARRHRESLRRELGEEILRALEDPNVTEVLLNADGKLWLDSHADGLAETGISLPPIQAQGLIATVAGLLGRTVGEENPILEAELPLDGSRFEALLPPVVKAPIFAIRKRAERVIPLGAYLDAEQLTAEQAVFLCEALARRRNLLVSGGPGSGKTTFVNALLHQIASTSPEHRLCLLEDTYELRCHTPNHVSLHATDQVGLRQLVKGEENKKIDWGEQLRLFLQRLDDLKDLLNARLSVARLDSEALVRHLHFFLTGLDHPVRLDGPACYPDILLASQDLYGGFEPRIGQHLVAPIAITGFPAANFPGILDFLGRLALPHRFSSRWLPLDAAAALPKRDYYYTSPTGRRLIDLTLGPFALAFVGAGDPESLRCIRQLARTDPAGWPARWLEERGLPTWAINLKETTL